jgi:hypothetical protein
VGWGFGVCDAQSIAGVKRLVGMQLQSGGKQMIFGRHRPDHRTIELARFHRPHDFALLQSAGCSANNGQATAKSE